MWPAFGLLFGPFGLFSLDFRTGHTHISEAF